MTAGGAGARVAPGCGYWDVPAESAWEAEALALFAQGLAPSEIAARLEVEAEEARRAVVRGWKRDRMEEKRRSWRGRALACGKEEDAE